MEDKVIPYIWNPIASMNTCLWNLCFQPGVFQWAASPGCADCPQYNPSFCPTFVSVLSHFPKHHPPHILSPAHSVSYMSSLRHTSSSPSPIPPLLPKWRLQNLLPGAESHHNWPPSCQPFPYPRPKWRAAVQPHTDLPRWSSLCSALR